MEYKTVVYQTGGLLMSTASEEILDKLFNKMAKDGWEYVDNRDIQSSEFTTSIIFIFKRNK